MIVLFPGLCNVQFSFDCLRYVITVGEGKIAIQVVSNQYDPSSKYFYWQDVTIPCLRQKLNVPHLYTVKYKHPLPVSFQIGFSIRPASFQTCLSTRLVSFQTGLNTTLLLLHMEEEEEEGLAKTSFIFMALYMHVSMVSVWCQNVRCLSTWNVPLEILHEHKVFLYSLSV